MAFGRLDNAAVRKIREVATGFWTDFGQPFRPIPVDDLAQMAGIVTFDRNLEPGIEACLIPDPVGLWYMYLTTASDSPLHFRTRRRFTVGHELGHFAIPSHRGRAYYCRKTDIGVSFEALPLIEDEANWFSAELLMPARMFKRDMDLLDVEIHEAVRLLSSPSYYNTSKMATYIRYVTLLDKAAMLVVYGRDGRKQWHCTSEVWGSDAALCKLSPPRTIPALSCARGLQFSGNSPMTRVTGRIEGSEWFPGLRGGQYVEEGACQLTEGSIFVSVVLEGAEQGASRW